jgi:hypothetical protein
MPSVPAEAVICSLPSIDHDDGFPGNPTAENRVPKRLRIQIDPTCCTCSEIRTLLKHGCWIRSTWNSIRTCGFQQPTGHER